VARRVLLKDLFEGNIVQFAACIQPQQWSRICNHFQDIFTGTGVADFIIRIDNLRETDNDGFRDLWEFLRYRFSCFAFYRLNSQSRCHKAMMAI